MRQTSGKQVASPAACGNGKNKDVKKAFFLQVFGKLASQRQGFGGFCFGLGRRVGGVHVLPVVRVRLDQCLRNCVAMTPKRASAPKVEAIRPALLEKNPLAASRNVEPLCSGRVGNASCEGVAPSFLCPQGLCMPIWRLV